MHFSRGGGLVSLFILFYYFFYFYIFFCFIYLFMLGIYASAYCPLGNDGTICMITG